MILAFLIYFGKCYLFVANVQNQIPGCTVFLNFCPMLRWYYNANALELSELKLIIESIKIIVFIFIPL